MIVYATSDLQRKILRILQDIGENKGITLFGLYQEVLRRTLSQSEACTFSAFRAQLNVMRIDFLYVASARSVEGAEVFLLAKDGRDFLEETTADAEKFLKERDDFNKDKPSKPVITHSIATKKSKGS